MTTFYQTPCVPNKFKRFAVKYDCPLSLEKHNYLCILNLHALREIDVPTPHHRAWEVTFDCLRDNISTLNKLFEVNVAYSHTTNTYIVYVKL